MGIKWLIYRMLMKFNMTYVKHQVEYTSCPCIYQKASSLTFINLEEWTISNLWNSIKISGRMGYAMRKALDSVQVHHLLVSPMTVGKSLLPSSIPQLSIYLKNLILSTGKYYCEKQARKSKWKDLVLDKHQ